MKRRQRELLLKSIQSDDLLVFGDNNYLNDKIKEKEEHKEEVINEQKEEKPTARGILEKVLKNIEYKNEMLINHNQEKNKLLNKKGTGTGERRMNKKP